MWHLEEVENSNQTYKITGAEFYQSILCVYMEIPE
jgi:hypothetical protein